MALEIQESYLTKANSLRLITSLNFKELGHIDGEVYLEHIYFLNEYENNYLLILKELYSNPESFIDKFYKPIKVDDDKLLYVFEGIKPAYHSTAECVRLNSNYKNYEIPSAIREKGKSEVDRFRDWFKKNQHLLDKPDIFVAKLEIAFKVTMNTNSINYENSGVEVIENLNLEELEKRINKLLKESKKYYTSADTDKKEIIRRYQKYTFLAYSEKHIKNNDTRFSDETIKKFLKQYDLHFKRPFKELLIEYYRVKYNPKMQFKGTLLDQLGFRACNVCHKETINTTDLIIS